MLYHLAKDITVPIATPTPGAPRFAFDTASTLQCSVGPGLPNNRIIVKKVGQGRRVRGEKGHSGRAAVPHGLERCLRPNAMSGRRRVLFRLGLRSSALIASPTLPTLPGNCPLGAQTPQAIYLQHGTGNATIMSQPIGYCGGEVGHSGSMCGAKPGKKRLARHAARHDAHTAAAAATAHHHHPFRCRTTGCAPCHATMAQQSRCHVPTSPHFQAYLVDQVLLPCSDVSAIMVRGATPAVTSTRGFRDCWLRVD